MIEDDFVIAYRAIAYKYLRDWVNGFIQASNIEKEWTQKQIDEWCAALVTTSMGIMASWAGSWTSSPEPDGNEEIIKLIFGSLTNAFTKAFEEDMEITIKLGEQL